MRKPVVSGKLCPFHCKKYITQKKHADDYLCWADSLKTELRKLQEEQQALREQIQAINDILSITENGYQLLGVAQPGSEVVATFIARFVPGNRERTVFLCKLPITGLAEFDFIRDMRIRLKGTEAVFLVDWGSKIQDRGYGSIMMKHLICYLQSAGFERLTGSISHVDFDHLEKLIHFYTKFGFQITERENSYDLLLDLLAVAVKEHQNIWS